MPPEQHSKNARIKFDIEYKPFLEKIERIEPDLVEKIRNSLPISLSQDEITRIKQKYTSIETDLTNLNTSYFSARNEEQRYKNFKERIDQLEITIKANISDLTVAQESARLNLPSPTDKPIPEDLRTQIENVIFEFHAMRSFLGGMVYTFALAPSDILVLVLVVVMGLLGSSLQLSYIYVNEYAARPITFYLFRPFLGIIMALVIYIVAKAGIPLFTDASRTGGNAPINPYFISFLGIISGLLSERALEGLRQLGSNYFREGEGEPLRWARGGLREQLKTINREPKNLLPFLNIDNAELDLWLDGKRAVPANVQTIIAAVLNKPRRDIFTDFPPTNAPNLDDA